MGDSDSANYGGRVPNPSATVRQFKYRQEPLPLWTSSAYNDNSNIKVITTASENIPNVYIPGDLYVGGLIINPVMPLQNVSNITNSDTKLLSNLETIKYNNSLTNVKYGFTTDMEINNIIPLLVSKINQMDEEIKNLKNKLNK
jgi:hypothetical protein